MKIEKYTCDRCGMKMNQLGVVNCSIKISGRRLGNAVDYYFGYPGETGIIDLCEDCHNMLQDSIKVFFSMVAKEGEDYSEVCSKDKKSVVFGEKINPTNKVVLERYCSKTGKWIALTPDEIKSMVAKE